MDNKFSFKIDNVFNVFAPTKLTDLVKTYNLDKYYCLNQIHSDIVNIVDDKSPTNITGDALVTNQKKLPLVIRTADCISLVIYDKEKKVLATVHSGWRGTLNGIVNNAIDTMINKFNCNPSNIEAYLYPSIRNCHFEVDNDVYQLFKLKYNDYITKKDTKYLIDLQSIVKSQLTLLGITKITDSNICTYCNNDKYYSYRFNKTNERNYLIAYIEE